MRATKLLEWMDRPPLDRGIRFAQADSTWTFHGYAELAERARRAADALAGRGVRADDVVVLLGRSGPDFVAALYGVLLAGATPSLLAPLLAFQDLDAYRAHLRGVLRTASPVLALVDEGLAEEAEILAAEGAESVPIASLLSSPADASALAGTGAGRLALLQFTSGSSGSARGVRLPYAAVEANIAAIHAWLRWTPEDAFVSWLPLHHDMGLVGGLLSAVTAGSDLWLMQPEQFVREPLRYLRALATPGVRLTVTASFALEYIVRRVAPAALEGLDFSGLRGMVIGAERIDARALDDFHALLSAAGLAREALLPAYGLAEATLAVTGVDPGAGWTREALDPASLAPGMPVRAANGPDATVVVGCGRPAAGVRVTIDGEDGAPLPDGYVGEIVVRGVSVAEGYAGAADASATALRDGELRTGDAGFVRDGQLFVLGRLGDSLKVRGRMVFSEDLEVALAAAGVPRPRIAVLLGEHEGAPTAVLLSEEPQGAWRPAAEALLRRQTGGARVVFVATARGGISRTSSGKPRRRPLWHAFATGALQAASPFRHTAPAHG
ncbi:AMP-binding protein [Longimicrobium terrae]|uniref:Acyl-CoA synthetase (AMP-forming)/AMP-acid ligase II n=1 Tax=Longimicrobium terrae TaxID=1639882 RepID=A0A841H235_9BACT|nr:AMP-binding protein [Longimicrobium terrae]MBB4637599.1 acyl-CoA synthetase (AMP-forming)/AMP-acid ligase II [Longimicrobium terrae]MBB6071996.1 acyl-CoA synthetase (AMP-forming)/AMP-acid ligase II [Longimicrobium terrae]NNC29917.1 AMP-binding protein [Longimicrobium terrae]